jgi:carboxypeptidase C (cathepsin A)
MKCSWGMTLALIAVFSIGASAQQAGSANDQPNAKSKKNQATAATKVPENSPAPAAKPAEPAAPAPEHKSDASKENPEGKEDHYDVAEVPSVVTHHQITVDGKVLHYTATAGRLPIERADGKIEAEMFFVAYTLDGQDASKRPLTFAFNGGPGAASCGCIWEPWGRSA